MRLERTHFWFTAICLIWGTTWVATKAGLTVVPPSLLAGTRFVVAGTVLLVAIGWRGDRLRIARRDLPRLAVVAGLMVTATYALLFWGAVYLSTGLAAILDMAFLPVALLGIGALLGEDRFTPARAVGVAVGVAGLLILFGPKAFAGGAPASAMELLAAGAVVLSALVYSLALQLRLLLG